MKRMKALALLLVAVFLLIAPGCAPSETASRKTPVSPAEGAIVLKFIHSGSDTSNIHLTALYLQEDLAERSGGRIRVDVYPGGQFGGDIDNIEALISGENTFDLCASSPLSVFEPKMAVFDLPFLFSAKETPEETMRSVFRALDTPEAKDVLSLLESKGIMALSFSGYGFRELTSNRPIRTLADLDGLKIRTMENKYNIATWRALGASPTPMSYTEIYDALEQKVIDAQENPLDLIYSSQFYKVQKYIINTHHTHATFVFQMSKKVYDELPPDLQPIVLESVEAATAYSRSLAISSVSEIIDDLKAKGNVFIDIPPNEYRKLKQAALPIWDEIRADIGDETVDKMIKAAESSR